jgi:hypothetical protein
MRLMIKKAAVERILRPPDDCDLTFTEWDKGTDVTARFDSIGGYAYYPMMFSRVPFLYGYNQNILRISKPIPSELTGSYIGRASSALCAFPAVPLYRPGMLSSNIVTVTTTSRILNGLRIYSHGPLADFRCLPVSMLTKYVASQNLNDIMEPEDDPSVTFDKLAFILTTTYSGASQPMRSGLVDDATSLGALNTVLMAVVRGSRLYGRFKEDAYRFVGVTARELEENISVSYDDIVKYLEASHNPDDVMFAVRDHNCLVMANSTLINQPRLSAERKLQFPKKLEILEKCIDYVLKTYMNDDLRKDVMESKARSIYSFNFSDDMANAVKGSLKQLASYKAIYSDKVSRADATMKEAVRLYSSARSESQVIQSIEYFISSGDVSKITQDIENDIRAAMCTRKVLDVVVYKKNRLHIFTDTLVVNDEKLYDIGKFIIDVDMGVFTSKSNDINVGAIRFDNLTRKVDAYNAGMQAPHIFSNGEACFGSAINAMVDAIKAGKITPIAVIGISFIETVNRDDAAGCKIDRWPTITAKENALIEKRAADRVAERKKGNLRYDAIF